jgi:glutamate/tyrosine decarboxylase-like PLP-dependent enzyme
VPTAAEIAAAAAEVAEIGVQSATTGDQSTTAMDPEKLLRVADKMKANEAASGTNANGGSKSGWGMLRQARTIPPGAV